MTLSHYVLSKITAAMEIIPSDDTWPLSTAGAGNGTIRELDEPEKIQTVLGALFVASAGSSEGCGLATTWCRNYVGRGNNILENFDAARAWDDWQQHPPVHLNVNTLFSIAESVRPGWQRDWHREHSEQQQQGTVEPVDLWGKFDPPPLPIDLLPEAIEAYAREQGELMGCDPAGLAMSALTVCAAAIPDRIKLKPKRHEPWTESARLWVALVGNPSSMKSPQMRATADPLVRLDTQMWRAYVDAKATYDDLSRDERRTALKPKQTRLRIEDTTIEAAQEILKDSPDGVLLLRDEISGWFGAMDKYSGSRGAAADRGFWLQAYNGGSFAYNRISRGSGLIKNLSVSILGGIQPEPMRKIAEGSVDDGLLQRVIVVMIRGAEMGKDEPTSTASERYTYLIPRLRELEPPFDCLALDDGAMEVRERLERKNLELMGCEGVSKKLAEHIGKYNGIFARLCVIWHCVEHYGEELPALVSEQTATKVAEFMHRFLLPHALAFYAGVLGLSDDHDRLAAVAGYILARRLEWITNRDVQRGDRTMRNIDFRDIVSVFNQLDALGWVFRIPGVRPSDPARWKVNPEVHRRFAERAEREAARRKQARDMIAEVLGRQGDEALRDNADTS